LICVIFFVLYNCVLCFSDFGLFVSVGLRHPWERDTKLAYPDII